MAVCIVKAGHQAFGLDGTDLLFGKVQHRHHLPAHQLFGLVERGDLGAGLAQTQGRTEVHLKEVGGLARLGEHFGRHDAAYAQFHLQKIVKADWRVQGRGCSHGVHHAALGRGNCRATLVVAPGAWAFG